MRTNLFVVGTIESDSRGPARNQSCQTSSSIIIFPLLTTMNLSSFFFSWSFCIICLFRSVGRSLIMCSVRCTLYCDESNPSINVSDKIDVLLFSLTIYASTKSNKSKCLTRVYQRFNESLVRHCK